MSIKGYAAILTATLTGIFTVDCLWAMTRMDAVHVMATAMFAAMAAGVTFALFAYKEEQELDKEPDSQSEWVTCENGLQVMIQSSRRKVAP